MARPHFIVMTYTLYGSLSWISRENKNIDLYQICVVGIRISIRTIAVRLQRMICIWIFKLLSHLLRNYGQFCTVVHSHRLTEQSIITSLKVASSVPKLRLNHVDWTSVKQSTHRFHGRKASYFTSNQNQLNPKLRAETCAVDVPWSVSPFINTKHVGWTLTSEPYNGGLCLR
jgi:hypothetical protein